MKKFNYEERGGIYGAQIKYPDDTFDENGVLIVDGMYLWVAASRLGNIVIGYYKGTLELEDYVPDVPPVVPVAITSLTGALTVSQDFSTAVVTELTPFTFTASVPLGVDSTFLMPIKRIDTGRTVYVTANVVSDVLTVTASLPTSGKWVCGEDEINSNLTDETFSFSFSGITITAVQ
jgi:hypothetical protein